MDEALARDTGLLLARHGQTDDNLDPLRAQGFRDTPLNEVGIQQAHALAERVAAEFEVGSLWSSDLSRALATARIVGERIGLEPRLDARLREGNRGDWEGRLFVDIARDEPDAYAAWMRGGELPLPRRRVAAGALGPGLGRAPGHPRGRLATGAGRLPSRLHPRRPVPLGSARARRLP